MVKTYLINFSKKHAAFWNRKHYQSVAVSLVCFGVAMFIQHIADSYVSNLQGVPVNDVLLNTLPALDIDGLILTSALIFTFIVVGLLIFKPRYISFQLKTLSLFLITRSFFISLTHLGSNPHELQFDPATIGYWLYNALYNTHGDFFFSGHTGLPFLMAFIFWPEKGWRELFFVTSLVFGIGVLFAHIHYSIDVFAAPFMTYGIFAIARNIFRKDFAISRGQTVTQV